MNINLKPNDKFNFLYKCNDRFVILRGSAGSGKSYSTAQFVVYSMITNPGIKWLVLRKTATTLKESVYALLKDVISDLGVYSKYRINKTDKSFEFLPNGSQVIMAGLDDVEKLKSIHGVDKVWIEEASEITESDFKQINLRLRGIGKNQSRNQR